MVNLWSLVEASRRRLHLPGIQGDSLTATCEDGVSRRYERGLATARKGAQFLQYTTLVQAPALL